MPTCAGVKRYILLIASLLFTFSVSVYANNGCPTVKDIQRTSGEFSWFSKAPGWTGHFAYPQQAKGNSTHVLRFMEARWIQLTNLENSQGFFECDYQGNYDDEIIRFVQAGTRANVKPTDPHWACQLNPHFPGVQCQCSAGAELCRLEAINNAPGPTPIYINPEATSKAIPPLPSETYRDK